MGHPRAGLIPYYVDQKSKQIKMMFMRPSATQYGGDQWQLAKGKIDPGEDAEQAAVREAQEELGLFKSNIDGLQFVGVFLKSISVYVCKVKDREMFGQPSFETDETVWLTLDEFEDQGRPLHIPLVRETHSMILERERNG